ncbi:MAG: hypothetical protein P9L93_03615 [Candidatus Gorgyraea atricola]|nr:hypothetical protein [Candidatus Gorgyraea atricola]
MFRKIFTISAILMLVSTFLIADSGYALKKKSVTDDGIEIVDGETKKSALAGIDTLIEEAEFLQGQTFTTDKFRQMRREYGRRKTGNKKWDIGNTMLTNELNDMIMLGLIERTSTGNYKILQPMNKNQMKAIDAAFGTQIKPLTRKDGSREANIGLNSFDLIGRTSDEEKTQMKRIVSNVSVVEEVLKNTNRLDLLKNPLALEAIFAFKSGSIVRTKAEDILKSANVDIGSIFDDLSDTSRVVTAAKPQPAGSELAKLGETAQDSGVPAVTKPILKERFNQFSNTRVITITEAGLIGLPASARQKIKDKVINEGYALAIATNDEELFEEGKAEALIKEKLSGLEKSINTKVFFSLIKDAKTWSDLEKVIQKGVELGVLDESQAIAIRNALEKG